jgi:hypothetical protein
MKKREMISRPRRNISKFFWFAGTVYLPQKQTYKLVILWTFRKVTYYQAGVANPLLLRLIYRPRTERERAIFPCWSSCTQSTAKDSGARYPLRLQCCVPAYVG